MTVVLLPAALLLAGTQIAAASSVSDKQAEAKRIATERERLTQRAEQLNERAKRASDELAGLERQLDSSAAVLDTKTTAVGALQQRLADFALNSYVRGEGTGGLAGLFAADGPTESGLRRGYAPVVLGDRADVLDELRAAQQDVDQATKDLAARRQRQQELVATIQADRAEIDRTQAKLSTLASKVDRELADAIAAEQARQAAAAEAAAAARQRVEQAKQAALAAERARAEQTKQAAASVASRAAAAQAAANRAAPSAAAAAPGRVGTAPAADEAASQQPVSIPPTSPAAAIAVTEALRQLGKTYVFGTNGPDTFDCSGLTQWAWAKAGVAMAHYTVSQFNAFPHIPLEQLQPGDLVFFNIDLGHMGMYIGNGRIIHAPRTGDVVKISPLQGRSVVGAVRPG